MNPAVEEVGDTSGYAFRGLIHFSFGKRAKSASVEANPKIA
ncbi:hypothetical protein D3OALGA1CA_4504 [Olavius algarvensis associated proteobacterium Delta 3]|nr:hypothetical protein D3OALGB2SA_2365 [Olavius algarvensis associated proteobacterium Delta 3]CAB5152350.1 hypothetical protein D3OALGA1CA_4504 [Olavius algarvensis associated proteobacterium Delta 3]